MKYFAYGSNMFTGWLKSRVSSASNPTHYALRKYQLRFHKKSVDCSGKCSIVATESDADVVHGILFDVADNQICDLDKAEGVDNGYQKEKFTFMLGDTETKAFVYVAEKNAIDDTLMPYCWYYDLVLAGAEQHELPSDYIADLRAAPFTQDPKADRPTRLKALSLLKRHADSKKDTT